MDTALSASGGRSGAKVSLLAVLSTTGGGSEAETALSASGGSSGEKAAPQIQRIPPFTKVLEQLLEHVTKLCGVFEA